MSRSEHSGRPDGCFARTLGVSDGATRVLEVCPGEGGYRGLAGEAFGIDTLILRDPVTGEVLPAEEVATGGGAVVLTDPRLLAERAAAALDLPAPTIRMNPDGDQVVRLPTWLWLPASEWEPRQVSASAGPVTATVTATPVRVRWDMGNGDRVVCQGPGMPYRDGVVSAAATDCSYTWVHSSAGQPGEVFEVSATVDWELTWTATGAPGGGDLGTVPSTASDAVRVTEVQALVQ